MEVLFETHALNKFGVPTRIIVERGDTRHPSWIADQELADRVGHPVPEIETNTKIQIQEPDGSWHDCLIFIQEHLTKDSLRNQFIEDYLAKQ